MQESQKIVDYVNNTKTYMKSQKVIRRSLHRASYKVCKR